MEDTENQGVAWRDGARKDVQISHPIDAACVLSHHCCNMLAVGALQHFPPHHRTWAAVPRGGGR